MRRDWSAEKDPEKGGERKEGGEREVEERCAESKIRNVLDERLVVDDPTCRHYLEGEEGGVAALSCVAVRLSLSLSHSLSLSGRPRVTRRRSRRLMTRRGLFGIVS